MSPSTTATVTAARNLTAYRDGLFAHLMWLAQATAELPANEQTYIVQRLMAVFPRDESMRLAAQISTLATPCWGIFKEVGAQRLASVNLLRSVCLNTATAVRDELHRDACLCRDTAVTRYARYVGEVDGG